MDGVRVVECSTGLAGRLLSGFLADYGAEVVRVESGQPDRGVPDRADRRAVFDRGKRSIICDLTSPSGREVVVDLLTRADVFVEAWRSGVAEAHDLGYETLRLLAPRLVYCSISGDGLIDRGGCEYEATAQAAVGLMGEQMGYRDGPIFAGYPTSNQAAAVLGVLGTVAALYRREITGQGERVDTSLVDGVLAMMAMFWQDAENPTKVSNARSIDPHTRVMQGAYLCADGEYLGIHTAAPGAHARCMEVLGLSDRIAPAATLPEMAQPLTDDEVAILQNELGPIWKTRPREEWLERMLAADVCAIPVRRATEAFDEPQVQYNTMVVTVDDGLLGRLEQVAPPVRFGHPQRLEQPSPRPAPTPGADTRAVLAELDYDDSKVAELLAAGIVR